MCPSSAWHVFRHCYTSTFLSNSWMWTRHKWGTSAKHKAVFSGYWLVLPYVLNSLSPWGLSLSLLTESIWILKQNIILHSATGVDSLQKRLDVTTYSFVCYWWKAFRGSYTWVKVERDQLGDHPTKRLVVLEFVLEKNRRCDCMLIVIFMRKHNTPSTGRRSDQLRAVLLNEKSSQKSCMLNQMLPGTRRKQHLSNSICLLVLLWMNHFYTGFHCLHQDRSPDISCRKAACSTLFKFPSHSIQNCWINEDEMFKSHKINSKGLGEDGQDP